MQDNGCSCAMCCIEAQVVGLQETHLTCVREIALDRVVGMQQKTVRPNASSGGCNGRRSATKPANGVMSRMVARP